MKEKIITLAHEVLNTEILAIQNLIPRLADDFVKTIEHLIALQGRLVVCGMGKSGHIARKVSATLASTGTPSLFLHPAEAFHGDLGMVQPEDTLLLFSHSGETDEVIKLLPFFKTNGNTLISLTGEPHSTLAKASDFHLDISIEKEACPLRLAPTASTTASLAMGDALAMTLMKLKNFQEQNFARFHPGGRLGRKLLSTVKDFMRTKDLPLVSAEADFSQVISTMTQGRLGMALVTLDKKVQGIITDGDIRRAMAKHGPQSFNLKAQDIFTASPLSIQSNANLAQAEELFAQKKVTVLVVSSDAGELEGILQIYDL